MIADFEHAIGLDIAAESFTACVVEPAHETPLAPVQEFANSSAGYSALEAWLRGHGVTPQSARIALEATGVYWEACALALHQSGWRVCVVNPACIRHFAKERLHRAKTDALDALVIARFNCNTPLRAFEPPDAVLAGWQMLMRQRDDLVAMLTQEKNRLHALEARPAGSVPRAVLRITREHIGFLEARIKKLEETFKKELAAHPQWQAMMELMLSIPGVGLITAATILTETLGLAAFAEARQLSSYAGIAPAQHDSGRSVRGRGAISKVGNPRLRRAVYQAALSAGQHNPRLAPFYGRLKARGKPVQVARVAVARKLLELVFVIVRSGQPFQAAPGPAPNTA